MKIRKISSLLISVVLLMCVLGGCSSSEGSSVLSLAEYKPVSTESTQYKLDVTDDGTVTLTPKNAQQIINAYPFVDEETTMVPSLVRSALAVTVYTPSTGQEIVLDSYSSSVMAGGVTVQRGKDEIVVKYDFLGSGFSVPVHYTLDNDRFVATVIPNEIQMEEDVLVKEIALHPYFGAGTRDQEGFMVVPDGSGALIEFNNTDTASQYKQKIYGVDQSLYRISEYERTQSVVMPVFGIGNSTTQQICLGVVTEGAADAYIQAEAGNGQTGYNGVWASFNLLSQDIRHYTDYRPDVKMYAEEIKNTGPLQVSYVLEETDCPHYTQLAKLYRTYLMNRYDLSVLDDETAPVSLDLVIASIKKKTILGIPYDGVEALTTYGDAKTIVEELSDKDIPTVLRLVNWSSETVWNKPLSKIGYLGNAGGKKGFQQLMNAASQNGKVFLSANISEVYSGGGILPKVFTYAKDMRGAAAQYQHFNLVTNFNEDNGHYLLSNKKVVEYATKFGEMVSTLNVGVSVEGVNTMYTDFSSANRSMTATVGTYVDTLTKWQERNIDLAVNNGNEFSLLASDFIFELPTSDSSFDITSDAIPFYQIAIHGVIPYSTEAINLSADTRVAFLKAVETGSVLQYKLIFEHAEAARYSRNSELYGATYEHWKSVIHEQYQEWKAILEDKATLEIVYHEKMAQGVYRTEYEDGSSVIVNYNDEPYTTNAISVEPLNYTVLKGAQ